jgi:hypothetical protein
VLHAVLEEAEGATAKAEQHAYTIALFVSAYCTAAELPVAVKAAIASADKPATGADHLVISSIDLL